MAIATQTQKQSVLQMMEDGMTIKQIADRVSVSIATLYRWKKQVKQQGANDEG